jgi:hypothetical protein
MQQPAEAIRLWGEPVALSDVSRIFSSYLRGTLTSNPWSEEPLRAETATISHHLIEMNDSRHWFSVGSQPAVDGAPSADLVHGFGPKGGYVYQKAFVEFFLTQSELDELERRSKEDEEKRREQGEADDGLVKFMAGNAKGEFRTNMATGDVNAVTWGVFGGKEIVTTTLIEEMSFRAWNVRTPFLSSLPSLTDPLPPFLPPRKTGRSLRPLVRMVPPLPLPISLSSVPQIPPRHPMARLGRTPRLQGPGWAVEVAVGA